MTQVEHPTEFDAKAADSGANATRVFQSKESRRAPRDQHRSASTRWPRPRSRHSMR